MTLSALSMQMKTLEQALGVALFDRSARPPRLTPVGRAVVDEAVLLLRHEEKLIEISQPRSDLTGRFRIGFITTAAVRLLPRFLLKTSRDAPRATFEIETGLSADLQNKVLTGQLDAAVITDADGLPDQLESCVLRREPLVFAAHRRLLEGGLAGLMSDAPFFHFMPDTGIGKLIAHAMMSHRRPENAETIVLDNLEATMECVAEGLGFTLLPVPDVSRYRTPDIGTLRAPTSLQRKLVLAAARDGPFARRFVTLLSMFGDIDVRGGIPAEHAARPTRG